MKRVLQLLRRNLIALTIGGLCAITIGAIFPVFTIGFWRVTFASQCAIGFVGIGGSPAVESLIVSGISAAPAAKTSFRLMYAFGNAQGKLYAVMGMRYVDWDEFRRMRDDIVQKPGYVFIRSGCLGTEESFEWAMIFDEEMQYSDDELRKKEVDGLREHFKTLKNSKEKKANQALLPTPMSVTDRAGARSAPDTGAADL